MFKDVPTQTDFIRQEHEILNFWKETGAFEKRWQLGQGGPRWSFIDGPITANNPMGVHHAWGRTYKDLFNRYWAMKGYELRYQQGFDCQGLWIEVEVEKELAFKSKRDIEAYGIADFVRLCKQRVLKYAAVQSEQSIRLGYWMDWNDPDFLRWLHDKMGQNPREVITVEGPRGPVTDTIEGIVGRLGMPELGGSYFTFSDENNYTIWTALKMCHERGWIYKGHDVMPWCARCGTGISQHEIVTEGYQELTHPSITLRFPLRNRPGESLLVWTTTPWTLTSNVAAAVHPELTYALVAQGSERFWLARGAVPDALHGEYTLLGEKPGIELEGWTYEGPFDELPVQRQVDQDAGVSSAQAHRVILWDEVSETEGTGIVHIAPGCGAEDLQLGQEYNLPVLAPLDEFGVFVGAETEPPPYGWLTGMSVHDTAQPIFDNLTEKGLTYHIEDYTHRYPVCWRCGEELVFRLVDEWLISMGEKLDKPYEQVTEEEKERNLRYQIMEAVTQTRWIPDFGYDQEMDWLRNMHDWMISKKRYYGLALPIWECGGCGHFEVIGSREELQERAVEGWEAFEGHTPHRPWIDAVKIRCPQCGATVSRIPDVGNPWLDAGIVACSTVHYNLDRQYWEKWVPADLITESFPGQFRNWFYSLLAMTTIMERIPAFKTIQTYATLFAEDGRPMHKSWGNAIWFDDAAETMGVDVMRWMYCAHKPEQNWLFGYRGADETRRRFLLPIWNVYSFLVTYANIDGWTPNPSTARYALLDRWILSRLQVVIQTVTGRMDEYDVLAATVPIEGFIDDLTNWYVRRSRRRFWRGAGEDDADKEAAYRTLYTCLVTLCRLLAPFTPFFVEAMYQNLVRSVDGKAPQSVHHNDWPVADETLMDDELVADMELATRVASLGRSARNSAGIKLRQPLAKALVVAPQAHRARLERLADLVTDELNVKALAFGVEAGELVEYQIGLRPDILGKKHGPLFPKVRAAVASMDAADLARRFNAGLEVEVTADGQTVALLPEEVEVQMVGREGYAIAEERGLLVGVDVTLTDELVQEGTARDIVRRIQNLRKEAGFDISDRITTYYQAGPELAAVFGAHGDYIAAETLSTGLVAAAAPQEAFTASFKLGGEEVTLGVMREAIEQQ